MSLLVARLHLLACMLICTSELRLHMTPQSARFVSPELLCTEMLRSVKATSYMLRRCAVRGRAHLQKKPAAEIPPLVAAFVA